VSVVTGFSDNSLIKKMAKHLHTDLHSHLDKMSAKATCISCLECIKPKDRPLSYKYNPNM